MQKKKLEKVDKVNMEKDSEVLQKDISQKNDAKTIASLINSNILELTKKSRSLSIAPIKSLTIEELALLKVVTISFESSLRECLQNLKTFSKRLDPLIKQKMETPPHIPDPPNQSEISLDWEKTDSEI